MKPSSTEQPVLAVSDLYRQGRCRRCGGADGAGVFSGAEYSFIGNCSGTVRSMWGHR